MQSDIYFPQILKIENNWLSLQLLVFSIFGKKHQDKNNISMRKCLQYTLQGIHVLRAEKLT